MSDTQPRAALRTYSKPLHMQYDVMFDRDIEAANEFHEEFYYMRSAEKDDLVNVHIDSWGGAVSTISVFQNIVTKSEATFHGILEGNAYSAGGAIFLLCHTHEVADFASMMIHTQQMGYSTHSQGIYQHGEHAQRTSETLVKTVYKHFLTEEEISDILKGAEMWLDAEQIRERLKVREAALDEEYKKSVLKESGIKDYIEATALDLKQDCEYWGLDYKQVVQGLLPDEEVCPSKDVEATNSTYTSFEDLKIQEELINKLDKIVSITGSYEYKIACIQKTDGIFLLAAIARDLGIKYSHNIGLETLRNRILGHLGILE